MMTYVRMKAGCELISTEFAIDPEVINSYTINVTDDGTIEWALNKKDSYGFLYPTIDSVIDEMNEREEILICGLNDE